MTLASKPFYTVADRILGSQFLEDIAEFFSLFQTMAPGSWSGLTPSPASSRTAAPRSSWCPRWRRRRCTRPSTSSRRSTSASSTSALSLCSTRCCLPTPLQRHHGGGQAALRRGRRDLAARGRRRRAGRTWPGCCARWGRASSTTRWWPRREAEQRASLARSPEVVAAVPYFDADIADLSGLLALGDQIWR
ncbi:MAG: hypothetical protein R2746_13470 [Acidimicrobiales bacterium]